MQNVKAKAGNRGVKGEQQKRKPVLLIPGLGGSILVKRGEEHMRILGRKVVHNRWLNIYPMSPHHMEMWKEDMKIPLLRSPSGLVTGYDLRYNQLQPLDVGGIKGICNVVPEFELLPKMYQDAFQNHFSHEYYKPLCTELLGAGYKEYKDLFGFPYDFRLILDPVFREEMMLMLKSVIETARSSSTEGEGIVIVTHSLGGLLLHWFLTCYVDPDWIDYHVDSIIGMNVPFGGCTAALKTILYGEYYLPFLRHMFMDGLQTNSGVVMCVPNSFSHAATDVFIEDKQNNKITIDSYDKIKQGEPGLALWRDLYKPWQTAFDARLNVKYYGITTNGVETGVQYQTKDLSMYPDKMLKIDDGDGYVTTKSMEMYKVFYPRHANIKVMDVGHSGVVCDWRVIHLITRLALGLQ